MPQLFHGLISHGKPWRRGIAWWLVLVEGMVAVVAGIALLAWPQESASLILVVFGAYALVNGLLRIYAGMRMQSTPERVRPVTLVTGGIGLVVGLLVILQPLSQYIDTATAATILGIGLILIGFISLYDVAFPKDGRWGSLSGSGLHIVLGILLLYVRGNPTIGDWLSIAAVVIGALLLAYGVILYRASSRLGEDATGFTPGKS